MSGTVIRVKRRLNEDPVDALLLSYKRRKTDGAETEADATAKALLTFTGTVEEKNLDAVKKVLGNIKTKAELKESFKSHVPDIAQRKRNDSQSRSKESRFKILSCNRAIAAESITEEDASITIVDVGTEDEVMTCNEDMKETEPKYVYDLYSTDFMPEEVDYDDGYLESLVSVEPFRTQSQYRGSEDCDEIDPCEEDSNDEGNWRNDYPDSDNSVNEDDMRLAASMHGMGIDNGVDLSSDSEDERHFMNTGMSPPRGFEAFKQRILREEAEDKKRTFIDCLQEVDDSSESDSGSSRS